MPARIEFTKSEIAEIVRLYTEAELSAENVAKHLGTCSQQTVVRVLKEQGIELRGCRILTDGEEEQIIKLYQHGVRCTEIVKAYKITSGYFRKMLIRRNIPSNRPPQYELNEHAFNAIDCEEAAYWLGFFYADGCVHKNRLSVSLSHVDAAHLEKAKLFLKTERPIRIQKQEGFGKVGTRAILYINNDHLTQSLKELGIIKNRPSYRLAVDKIPDGLIRHFLRGYVDGDGSIGKNRPRIRIFGQRDFLEWVRDTFLPLLSSKPRLDTGISKTRGIYVLGYYGRVRTREIITYLYTDATVYLDRKKALAEQWM